MTLARLRYLTEHPLNRRSRLRGVPRLLAWAAATRLLPRCEVVIPLVNQARLVVTPGRWGSEANALCGLHEFADMGFLLHLLRPADLFCDVGANVGTYTVLAAGGIGARCLAFEPVASSFADLQRNLAVNHAQARVDARQAGVGRRSGTLRLTTGQDTMNHVVPDQETGGQTVPIQTLDESLGAEVPVLIKIDVEGWEQEVLAGASRTLACPGLLAVILELNGSGQRYGFSDEQAHSVMTNAGFTPHRYRPFQRELVSLGGAFNREGNTLYVRSMAQVRERVASAAPFAVRDFVI